MRLTKRRHIQILNDEIKLEGKEKASDLELRDTGLVLVSEQNVIGLDLQGKERFRQYYPAPDNPGWMKALYALESINAALVSAQAAMISGAMQATGSKTSDPVAGKSGDWRWVVPTINIQIKPVPIQRQQWDRAKKTI